MAYWRLYYHLVWSTKERKKLITTEREANLYHYIIGKADNLDCIIHAINGMEDHIHIVTSIPPSLAISEFVKNIKGSSAHHFNLESPLNAEKFSWQRGYGVFSMGTKYLENAIAYVNNQKQHHAQATTNTYLERDDSENDAPTQQGIKYIKVN